MAKTIIFALLVLMAVAALSLPDNQDVEVPQQELESPLETALDAGPEARATCNIPAIGNAACAAHCKVRGYRTGSCVNKVCVCRR